MSHSLACQHSECAGSYVCEFSQVTVGPWVACLSDCQTTRRNRLKRWSKDVLMTCLLRLAFTGAGHEARQRGCRPQRSPAVAWLPASSMLRWRPLHRFGTTDSRHRHCARAAPEGTESAEGSAPPSFCHYSCRAVCIRSLVACGQEPLCCGLHRAGENWFMSTCNDLLRPVPHLAYHCDVTSQWGRRDFASGGYERRVASVQVAEQSLTSEGCMLRSCTRLRRSMLF